MYNKNKNENKNILLAIGFLCFSDLLLLAHGVIPKASQQAALKDLCDIKYPEDHKDAIYHKDANGKTVYRKICNFVANSDCTYYTRLGVSCDSFGMITEISLNVPNLNVPIPSSIGNLTSITSLNLAGCFFIGSIPSSFAKLKKLIFLHLGTNKLTGGFPLVLSKIPNLATILLYSNNLSGLLPPLATTDFPKVTLIVLSSNAFYGDIPSSYSKFFTLVLDYNSLTGAIPSTFKSSSNLNAYGNALSGVIPIGLNGATEIALGLNCLTYPPKWTKAKEAMRTSAQCKALCGANSATGVCGGHGDCLIKVKSPKCVCDKGYSLALKNQTCVLPNPPPRRVL